MSSISRVLRSRLKQPDGPGDYCSDGEEGDEMGSSSGRNPHRHGKTDSTSPGGSSATSTGHDNSKHSIDDILGNDKGLASEDGEFQLGDDR